MSRALQGSIFRLQPEIISDFLFLLIIAFCKGKICSYNAEAFRNLAVRGYFPVVAHTSTTQRSARLMSASLQAYVSAFCMKRHISC